MVKLTILFLAVVCLQATAAGQKETVTISGKDLSLEKVFSVIKKQTDYVCFYGYDVLKDARPVSLSFKNAEVSEVLKAALWGQGLDYSITGKTITIVKKAAQAALEESGKTIPVSGTVYNEAGQPLSGANVTIKTTGKGTITNARGEFMLPAVPENSPLVISFIGYAPQVMKISEGKAMQVYLTVAKNELDKVVVKAYGTTTQRLATGSIATVTSEEIERQPIMNPLMALQGHVAGMDVSQTNGYATSPIKVEIRGRNVLDPRTTSDPLYIVDGVPLTILELGGNSSNANGSTGFMQGQFVGPDGGQNPFFSINPNDIESVSVLKDADATAIYGSRGANGVVIITTKKGRGDKGKFEMNVYQGLSKITRFYQLLNTQQYVEMRREAFANDNRQMNSGNAYDLLIWDTTRYTNWEKFLWGGLGQTTDAQLSLSGGDKQNSFRLGGGYHRQTDITTYSGASERGSLQTNLSHSSLNQRLNISMTTIYSVGTTNMVNLQGLVTLPPNAPPAFDSRGNLNFREWDPVAFLFPFSNLKKPYSSTTYFLNSNLSIKYEIAKGLDFAVNVGYSFANATQHQIIPIASQDPKRNPLGSTRFGYNNEKNWIVEPQLHYKAFLGKSKIDVLVGASSQQVVGDGNSISGGGYTNDNLLGSISNAPEKDASDYYGRYKYAAIFSQINYNYQNKYIVNLSARRDGSSRFGPGNQFGDFGAIGGAWIFSEENWIKSNLKFLSLGKIRGSYGVTGSDQIGDYQYLTRWGASGIVPYQGFQSYVPTQLFNPDYQWAKNKKIEAALDLSFIEDRISFEFAWYQNRCGNQLISYTLPNQSGFASVVANSPANVQNRGVEITLNARPIDNKFWQWNVRFNISRNRNKLLAYPHLDESSYAYSYFIGQPLNITGLLHYSGIDKQTGQYTFEDKNKDGQIVSYPAANSDLFNYDLNPKFFGGFGSQLIYKGWALDIYCYFRKQSGYNSFVTGQPAGGIFNEPIQVLNRWQTPGQDALFARYTTTPTVSDRNFLKSNQVFSDASFIRINNISLAYSLSDKLVKHLSMKLAQIYFKGENLFVITDYKGIDPDVQFFGSMPLSKVLTVGIKCNF